MIHEFPTPIFHVKCKNWKNKKKYILDLLNPSFERIGGGFDQFFWNNKFMLRLITLSHHNLHTVRS